MEARYISTDNSGWLRVKLEPSGVIISLPLYLKVSFKERKNSRDYFRIEEGVHAGKNASVSQKSASDSWLGSPLPVYKGPVLLVFKKGEGKLQTPIGSLNATTDPSNPIPNGSHPVQIPDYPHAIGSGYVPTASKSLSWFFLGTGNSVAGSNERYLHTGMVSAGCVTMTDVAQWDSLYNAIILCRAPGGKNVGTITVQD